MGWRCADGRQSGAVAGELGFEIAEAVPVGALVQIDFGDGQRAPFFRLGEHAPVVVEDAGDHPVVL